MWSDDGDASALMICLDPVVRSVPLVSFVSSSVPFFHFRCFPFVVPSVLHERAEAAGLHPRCSISSACSSTP
eukprot:m.412729 g.412729  ORF g.412729 m.412729 type:complete len:72 (-) comp56568_c0_seq8:3730-3945(-)